MGTLFTGPQPTTFSLVPPGPAEDADLDIVFQGVVSSITGMDGTLVRPRWQTTPPKQPEPGTDWCAIGVLSSSAEGYPYITHLSGPGITDPAADLMVRHEELEVLASFYGPNSKSNAGLLRDGLQLHQNLDALEALDIGFVEVTAMRAVPDLVNQQWVRRFDLPMRFRRKVQRVYAVQNILASTVILTDDSGHINETITAPPPGR